MSEPLVIIGNGMVAARFVEELATCALGRYAVAVVGDEPRLAYNRVLLSSLLAGDVDATDIELRPARWWKDCGVTVQYGRPAIAVATKLRSVMLADGTVLPFSKLVLATGSRPITPDLPGVKLPGVLTFRDVRDVGAIAASGGPGRKAVVIGGGLLGLEAAYGLAKTGASVTLIHLMDRLMERQLDEPAAAMLKRTVEAMGITVLLEAETEHVIGTDRVEGVHLQDGRTIAADSVVVAIGTRPRVDLAHAAGLHVARGIVVDDGLETSTAGIHAIGECTEHRGQCYGLVQPGYEQGRVLARRLAGKDIDYAGSVVSTNLKVSGVHVFSAGDFMGSPGTEQITFIDPGLNIYKKLVVADGRLVGAVLFGDTADGLWYVDLIRAGTCIEPFRSDLIFGRALVDRMAA